MWKWMKKFCTAYQITSQMQCVNSSNTSCNIRPKYLKKVETLLEVYEEKKINTIITYIGCQAENM